MKLVVCITALTCAASNALAAPVNLTCRGILHQYFPTVEDGSIAPAATRVDLDNAKISTPLGNFRITKVDDSAVFFAGSSSGGYLAAGSLDRNSGQMNIRWLTEEEQAKLDRGGKAQMGMSADLKCSVATRLF